MCISSFDSVIIAFSGGVDSAYLAWLATQVLGPAALCVTADSPSYPDRHRQLALRTAREFGLRHEIIHTARDRASRVPRQSGQPLLLLQARAVHGSDGSRRTRDSPRSPTAAMPTIAATTGRAARRPASSASEVRWTKWGSPKPRSASWRAGPALPTWDEPASACLSSRIPYHSEVTDEKLRMIERAEEVLHDAGLPGVPRAPSRHARATRARTR